MLGKETGGEGNGLEFLAGCRTLADWKGRRPIKKDGPAGGLAGPSCEAPGGGIRVGYWPGNPPGPGIMAPPADPPWPLGIAHCMVGLTNTGA